MMEASGFTPSRSAACLVMSTRAAAPSFRVLALAAVTVPEELNMKKRITVNMHIYILLSKC